jgi:eukaryotic-like serine/threonine-protein kinase
MSYCINPECHNRQNPEDTKCCMTCRTPLLLYSDRFQIVEKISTSLPSHAWEVFRVIDTKEESGSRYKILKTLKNSSSLHKELFDREKTALRNLRHSGIPAYILDFTLPAERGRPELDCLIMELIEGQDLSKWVESNKLSDKERALKWLRKIVTILYHIHSKKYFHRDIKPGNIMLNGNEELFLIDYGIVRETTDTVHEKGASTKAYTPAYAAPEQKSGAAVPQSDFYALGRTFIHLLTGISPDKLLDISLWELETDFSASGIISLLKWMLETEPTQRPQTPEEIIEIIDYISSRKPDGNFPTGKDTKNQINVSKSKHEQRIVPEEATTIVPGKNISEPLKPDTQKVMPSLVPNPQRLKTTAFSWIRPFKIFGRVPKILPIFFMFLSIGTVTITYMLHPTFDEVCDSNTGNKISCGEEILLIPPNQGIRGNKKYGAQAIAKGDYSKAINLLNKDWEEAKDPETLIMLENAKLAKLSTLVRNIAVTIPGSSSVPIDIPTAMLKAVAFAQKEWNENPKNRWKLRLILVDDENDESRAIERTEILLKRGVHAGIGSYSSKATLATKDIYQLNKTVLISGTSTSGKLTNSSTNTFFFRVCSTNEKPGPKIKNYLIKNSYKKIVLFHTKGEPFSDSMTKELERNIGTNNIVKYFDFKNNGVENDQIKKAKELGAQAIILFPGAYASDSSERVKSLSIVKNNNGELPILGNEIVNDKTLLSSMTIRQLQNLVITLPWHPSTSESKEIKPSPDWWGEKSQLDHRIVLNYDAIGIVIEAIDKLPVDLNEDIVESRKKIQKILSAPEFKTEGYTGKISFDGSDRRESISGLVKPLCNGGNKCKGFEAVP